MAEADLIVDPVLIQDMTEVTPFMNPAVDVGGTSMAQPTNILSTSTSLFNDPNTTIILPNPISFFSFPIEVRVLIYHYLLSTIICNVDATSYPTVFFYRPHIDPTTFPFIPTINGPLTLQATNSFLTLSRRFFQEFRTELYRTMHLRFERRWDFLLAFANSSLHVDPALNHPSGLNTLSLYPLHTSVFAQISHLTLDLTKTSDFGGMVTNNEARRVTLNMLTILRQNMPSLRTLIFTVDKKSRVHSQLTIVLPHAWFLEALFAIRQVRTVKFKAGGEYEGSGSMKDIARACMRALNVVFKEYFAEGEQQGRLIVGVRSARKLQAKVGRKMLVVLEKVYEGDHRVLKMYRLACDALEANS